MGVREQSDGGQDSRSLFFFFFLPVSTRRLFVTRQLYSQPYVDWLNFNNKNRKRKGFLKNGRTFANWEKNNKEKVWPVFLFLSFFTVFKPVKKKKRGGEGRNEF